MRHTVSTMIAALAALTLPIATALAVDHPIVKKAERAIDMIADAYSDSSEDKAEADRLIGEVAEMMKSDSTATKGMKRQLSSGNNFAERTAPYGDSQGFYAKQAELIRAVVSNAKDPAAQVPSHESWAAYEITFFILATAGNSGDSQFTVSVFGSRTGDREAERARAIYDTSFRIARALAPLSEEHVTRGYKEYFSRKDAERLSPGTFDGVVLNLLDQGNLKELTAIRDILLARTTSSYHLLDAEYLFRLFSTIDRPGAQTQGKKDPRLAKFSANALLRLARDPEAAEILKGESRRLELAILEKAKEAAKLGIHIDPLEFISTLRQVASLERDAPVARKILMEALAAQRGNYSLDHLQEIAVVVVTMKDRDATNTVARMMAEASSDPEMAPKNPRNFLKLIDEVRKNGGGLESELIEAGAIKAMKRGLEVGAFADPLEVAQSLASLAPTAGEVPQFVANAILDALKTHQVVLKKGGVSSAAFPGSQLVDKDRSEERKASEDGLTDRGARDSHVPKNSRRGEKKPPKAP